MNDDESKGNNYILRSAPLIVIGVIKEDSQIITKGDIRLVVTLENILKVEELNK